MPDLNLTSLGSSQNSNAAVGAPSSAGSAQSTGTKIIPENSSITSQKNPPSQPDVHPKAVDETLLKINRAFKERAAMQKAKELGLSYVNISVLPINPDLLKIIAPDKAKSALTMPFFRLGKRLRLAVVD